MLKFKSLAAGTLAVSAGLGIVSAAPALADTGRPAMGSQPAPARTSWRSTRPYGGTSSTAYRSYTSYRSYSTSSSWTGTRSTSSWTSSSSAATTSTTASTTTTAASTATSTTTDTTTTVSATGSCTLGTSASGTTCNQAIAFMLTQKASGSTAWHNRCLGLVSQAYGDAFSGYGTAAQAASAVSAAGLMHSTTDLASIPRGAVVWFANSSGYGHVVISLGNGLAISSDVANGSIGAGSGGVGVVPLSYFTQTWGQTLIGWSAPRA